MEGARADEERAGAAGEGGGAGNKARVSSIEWLEAWKLFCPPCMISGTWDRLWLSFHSKD